MVLASNDSALRLAISSSLILVRMWPVRPGVCHIALSKQSSWFRGMPVPQNRSVELSTICLLPVQWTSSLANAGFCMYFCLIPSAHLLSATSSQRDLQKLALFHDSFLHSSGVSAASIHVALPLSPKNSAFTCWINCSLLRYWRLL